MMRLLARGPSLPLSRTCGHFVQFRNRSRSNHDLTGSDQGPHPRSERRRGPHLPAMLILILALAACCATLAGGALALRLRDRLHLILGFSAGAVLAAAFFDLLPEALRVAGPAADPSNGIALAALGFFAYTILDRLILLHAHHDHGEQVRGTAVR